MTPVDDAPYSHTALVTPLKQTKSVVKVKLPSVTSWCKENVIFNSFIFNILNVLFKY